MADNNTAVGVNSLTAITTSGADNVAIGTNALAATTSGTQNVAVGSQAGATNAAAGSSGNILIGYNVDVPTNPTSNYLNIGGVVTGDMSSGSISSGQYKALCRVATTANLSATYSNGSSGVGATLTNSGTQAAISIDGVSLSLNDRVLVWNQTTQLQNGIYSVTAVGSGSTNWVLTRTTDFNNTSTIQPGAITYIRSGTAYANTNFQMTTAGPITVGTTSLVFVGSAGTAIAGAMVKLATGSVDTSVNSGLIDFSSLSKDVYLELQLRITNLVSTADNNELTLAFANQGTPVTGNNYSLVYCQASQSDTLARGVPNISPQGGSGNYVDGSYFMILWGFLKSDTSKAASIEYHLGGLSSGPTYLGGIGQFGVAPNSKTWDGLSFGVSAPGKFTFNWALYGVT